MSNKKIIKRGRYPFLQVTLVCPKHGVQKVYELENEDKEIKNIGCVECFKHLPTKELGTTQRGKAIHPSYGFKIINKPPEINTGATT